MLQEKRKAQGVEPAHNIQPGRPCMAGAPATRPLGHRLSECVTADNWSWTLLTSDKTLSDPIRSVLYCKIVPMRRGRQQLTEWEPWCTKLCVLLSVLVSPAREGRKTPCRGPRDTSTRAQGPEGAWRLGAGEAASLWRDRQRFVWLRGI